MIDEAKATEIPDHIEARLSMIEKTLQASYPTGLIPRREIGIATGGLLHPRTMANNDCEGKGIEGSFLVGRNRVYPIEGVIERLRSKVKCIPA